MSTEDNPKTVRRSALGFLSGTFLSRVTGLVREIATASFFGVAPAIAAFFVALRLAQLMRRLLGEGSLLAGFSPHFETVRRESPRAAASFFRDLFFSLVFLLVILVGAAEIGLFSFWKWGGFSEGTNEILYLTLLMAPGVLFVCLYALFAALLQSEKQYFIPGTAPVMFNLVFIAALVWVRNWPIADAVAALSLTVIAAFFFQWAMVIPGVFRCLKQHLKGKEWLRFELFPPGLKMMVKAMAYTIIGVGAVQINTALDAVFARYASLSGPAYLYYAMRLYQFPLSLFGIALASALLPPLSRAIQAGDFENFRKLLHYALSRTFSLMLPCTMAIFALGAVSINLLYGSGKFDIDAICQTTAALWSYGAGLVPSVFILLLAPAFYAQKDYKTPLAASLLSVGCSTVLNVVFVFFFDWGANSIAVSTSVAAAFNCLYLMRKLSHKIGPLFDGAAPKTALGSFGKTALCSGIAAGSTMALGHFLMGDISVQVLLGQEASALPHDLGRKLLQFFALGGFFALMLLSYAWLVNAEDILQFVGIRKKEEAREI